MSLIIVNILKLGQLIKVGESDGTLYFFSPEVKF